LENLPRRDFEKVGFRGLFGFFDGGYLLDGFSRGIHKISGHVDLKSWTPIEIEEMVFASECARGNLFPSIPCHEGGSFGFQLGGQAPIS
jgi:hypothetical protein